MLGAVRLDRPQQRRDIGRLDHQLGDKPLQVGQKPVLVTEEGLFVDVLQVDRALQPAHERGRVRRQAVQPPGQLEQQAMHHGGIRVRGQPGQRPQPEPDILQRHGLKLAAAPDLLFVHFKRSLGRLTLAAEPVQVAGAVEVLHRGDPAGVRRGPQVPPLGQLGQRVLHLIVAGRRRPVTAQCLADVLRPQVHDEPLLADPEHGHDPPVQLVQGVIQVRERAEGYGVHDNTGGWRVLPTLSAHARPAIEKAHRLGSALGAWRSGQDGRRALGSAATTRS